MKFEEYNEEYGRNEFGSTLNDELIQESAIKSVMMDSVIPTEEVLPEVLPNEYEKSEQLQQCLDSSLTDERELRFKKMYAAALIAAKEKGVQPVFASIDHPISTAVLVDDAFNYYKIGYQTASGQIDPIDAADALIDHAAVQTVVIADIAIEKGIPLVLNKLIDAVATKYPPAKALKPIVGEIARHIEPVAKKVARKGIQLMAHKAKSVVRQAVSTIKHVAKSFIQHLA